jgi:hypothetical protein
MHQQETTIGHLTGVCSLTFPNNAKARSAVLPSRHVIAEFGLNFSKPEKLQHCRLDAQSKAHSCMKMSPVFPIYDVKVKQGILGSLVDGVVVRVAKLLP